MYLLALRGRPLSQLSQKCFCQENSSIYSQYTVIPPVCFWTTRKHSISYSATLYKTPLNSNSFIRKKYLKFGMSELNYSSSSENQQEPEVPKLSRKDKLKRAVKDYGATVIIFHVTISLMSLGISYLVISSGVDVASLLDKIGLNSKSDIATGASTFVVAYALHKMFAPVRISITLGSTPLIVRYLRRVGVLKPPKSTGP